MASPDPVNKLVWYDKNAWFESSHMTEVQEKLPLLQCDAVYTVYWCRNLRLKSVYPLSVFSLSKRTDQIYMKCHAGGLNWRSLSEWNFVLKRSGLYHSVIRDFCVLSAGKNTFIFVTEMPVECKNQSLRRVAMCESSVLSVEEKHVCYVDENWEFYGSNNSYGDGLA